MDTYTSGSGHIVAFASKKKTARGVATKYAELFGYDLWNLADISTDFMATCKVIILVVANYGRGDAPPPTKEFWEHFSKLTGKPFLGVKFAIFGCGNSRYGNSYQMFTMRMRAKMLELGAVEIAPMGIHDAQAHDPSPIEKWPHTLQLEHGKHNTSTCLNSLNLL